MATTVSNLFLGFGFDLTDFAVSIGSKDTTVEALIEVPKKFFELNKDKLPSHINFEQGLKVYELALKYEKSYSLSIYDIIDKKKKYTEDDLWFWSSYSYLSYSAWLESVKFVKQLPPEFQNQFKDPGIFFSERPSSFFSEKPKMIPKNHPLIYKYFEINHRLKPMELSKPGNFAWVRLQQRLLNYEPQFQELLKKNPEVFYFLQFQPQGTSKNYGVSSLFNRESSFVAPTPIANSQLPASNFPGRDLQNFYSNYGWIGRSTSFIDKKAAEKLAFMTPHIYDTTAFNIYMEMVNKAHISGEFLTHEKMAEIEKAAFVQAQKQIRDEIAWVADKLKKVKLK